jgi:glyoxylase-like metal-dependent hydrolase (beta-lactamase superfamily II)
MFGEADDQAIVLRQPETAEEVRDATRALLACPTASIGAPGLRLATEGLFPELIEGGVSYCGYASRSSFGASAYFVERRGGNVLVDSPRFVPPLVRAFEDRGGVAHVLLTHRDDVADAGRYAAHFGSRVHVHREDRSAAPFATDILEGAGETSIDALLSAIAAPGHTRGSVVYLLDSRFLFTGDSLYWSPRRRRLWASRGACWYSWEEQARSLARLDGCSFEWVLPGHGHRARGRPEDWRLQLRELVGWMETGRLVPRRRGGLDGEA